MGLSKQEITAARTGNKVTTYINCPFRGGRGAHQRIESTEAVHVSDATPYRVRMGCAQISGIDGL